MTTHSKKGWLTLMRTGVAHAFGQMGHLAAFSLCGHVMEKDCEPAMPSDKRCKHCEDKAKVKP